MSPKSFSAPDAPDSDAKRAKGLQRVLADAAAAETGPSDAELDAVKYARRSDDPTSARTVTVGTGGIVVSETRTVGGVTRELVPELGAMAPRKTDGQPPLLEVDHGKDAAPAAPRETLQKAVDRGRESCARANTHRNAIRASRPATTTGKPPTHIDAGTLIGEMPEILDADRTLAECGLVLVRFATYGETPAALSLEGAVNEENIFTIGTHTVYISNPDKEDQTGSITVTEILMPRHRAETRIAALSSANPEIAFHAQDDITVQRARAQLALFDPTSGDRTTLRLIEQLRKRGRGGSVTEDIQRLAPSSSPLKTREIQNVTQLNVFDRAPEINPRMDTFVAEIEIQPIITRFSDATQQRKNFAALVHSINTIVRKYGCTVEYPENCKIRLIHQGDIPDSIVKAEIDIYDACRKKGFRSSTIMDHGKLQPHTNGDIPYHTGEVLEKLSKTRQKAGESRYSTRVARMVGDRRQRTSLHVRFEEPDEDGMCERKSAEKIGFRESMKIPVMVCRDSQKKETLGQIQEPRETTLYGIVTGVAGVGKSTFANAILNAAEIRSIDIVCRGTKDSPDLEDLKQFGSIAKEYVARITDPRRRSQWESVITQATDQTEREIDYVRSLGEADDEFQQETAPLKTDALEKIGQHLQTIVKFIGIAAAAANEQLAILIDDFDAISPEAAIPLLKVVEATEDPAFANRLRNLIVLGTIRSDVEHLEVQTTKAQRDFTQKLKDKATHTQKLEQFPLETLLGTQAIQPTEELAPLILENLGITGRAQVDPSVYRLLREFAATGKQIAGSKETTILALDLNLMLDFIHELREKETGIVQTHTPESGMTTVSIDDLERAKRLFQEHLSQGRFAQTSMTHAAQVQRLVKKIGGEKTSVETVENFLVLTQYLENQNRVILLKLAQKLFNLDGDAAEEILQELESSKILESNTTRVKASNLRWREAIEQVLAPNEKANFAGQTVRHLHEISGEDPALARYVDPLLLVGLLEDSDLDQLSKQELLDKYALPAARRATSTQKNDIAIKYALHAHQIAAKSRDVDTAIETRLLLLQACSQSEDLAQAQTHLAYFERPEVQGYLTHNPAIQLELGSATLIHGYMSALLPAQRGTTDAEQKAAERKEGLATYTKDLEKAQQIQYNIKRELTNSPPEIANEELPDHEIATEDSTATKILKLKSRKLGLSTTHHGLIYRYLQKSELITPEDFVSIRNDANSHMKRIISARAEVVRVLNESTLNEREQFTLERMIDELFNMESALHQTLSSLYLLSARVEKGFNAEKITRTATLETETTDPSPWGNSLRERLSIGLDHARKAAGIEHSRLDTPDSSRLAVTAVNATFFRAVSGDTEGISTTFTTAEAYLPTLPPHLRDANLNIAFDGLNGALTAGIREDQLYALRQKVGHSLAESNRGKPPQDINQFSLFNGQLANLSTILETVETDLSKSVRIFVDEVIPALRHIQTQKSYTKDYTPEDLMDLLCQTACVFTQLLEQARAQSRNDLTTTLIRINLKEFLPTHKFGGEALLDPDGYLSDYLGQQPESGTEIPQIGPMSLPSFPKRRATHHLATLCGIRLAA